MTSEDLIADALWWQEDARFLYAQANRVREQGKFWLATKIQENAAYSARRAREARDDLANF